MTKNSHTASASSSALEDGLSEMSMFGGLAFLLDGNMTVAVSSRGGLMLRVGAGADEKAMARPHVESVHMGSRPMKGWVRIHPDGLRTRRQLSGWVKQGVSFTRTLPPKRARARSR